MVYFFPEQFLAFVVVRPQIDIRDLEIDINRRFLEVQESYLLDEEEYIFNPWIIGFRYEQVILMSIDNDMAEDYTDDDIIPSLLIYLKIFREIGTIRTDFRNDRLSYKGVGIYNGVLTITHQIQTVLTITSEIELTRVYSDGGIDRAEFTFDDLRQRKFVVRVPEVPPKERRRRIYESQKSLLENVGDAILEKI